MSVAYTLTGVRGNDDDDDVLIKLKKASYLKYYRSPPPIYGEVPPWELIGAEVQDANHRRFFLMNSVIKPSQKKIKKTKHH